MSNRQLKINGVKRHNELVKENRPIWPLNEHLNSIKYFILAAEQKIFYIFTIKITRIYASFGVSQNAYKKIYCEELSWKQIKLGY